MRGARYGCLRRVALNDVGSDVSEDLDHSMDHSRVFLSVYSEFTGGLSAVDGAPPLRSEPWPSATVWLYTLSSYARVARGAGAPHWGGRAEHGAEAGGVCHVPRVHRLATRRRNHRRARSLFHDHPPPPRAPDAPPRRHRQHAVRRGPRVPPQLPHASITLPKSPPPSKPPMPKPSSTPPARACSVSHMGSCKVCVF